MFIKQWTFVEITSTSYIFYLHLCSSQEIVDA